MNGCNLGTYQLFASRMTISAEPLYSVIVPVAQTHLLLGSWPTLARSSPQISNVNIWFGYALSRLMKVGTPRLLVVVCSLAIVPHTASRSPRCLAASVALIVCLSTEIDNYGNTHDYQTTNDASHALSTL